MGMVPPATPDPGQVSERDSSNWLELFSGKLRDQLEAVPVEMLEMDEPDFVDLYSPTPTDWQLRKHFWKLIREAEQSGQEEIVNNRIFEGICGKRHFYNHIVDRLE